MTDTGVVYLDPDFVGTRWKNRNRFNTQRLSCLPSYCSLAGDYL